MAQDREAEVNVGVVLRRFPGVTKWKKWNWLPIAVVPGSNHENWKVLRKDGELTDFYYQTILNSGCRSMRLMHDIRLHTETTRRAQAIHIIKALQVPAKDICHFTTDSI